MKPDSPVHDVASDSEEAEEALQAKQKELDDLHARYDQLQDKVLEFEKQVSFCRDYWDVILTTSQQTAPSEDFVSRSPFYVLLLSHASKLEFDVKRGDKKLSEMTAELEVLRKERRELEVVFTVRPKTIIVLVVGILMECTDFQGARVFRGRL